MNGNWEEEYGELRRAARAYLRILEEQQRAAFGDEYREIIDAMEQSTTGTRKLADAKQVLTRLVAYICGHDLNRHEIDADGACPDGFWCPDCAGVGTTSE
jgi:hypothetical protein